MILLLKFFPVLIVLLLAGCGKKGPLEPPPSSTYPRPYPKTNTSEIGAPDKSKTSLSTKSESAKDAK